MPYAESIGAFKQLQDEGKVRWVGVSNASVEQLEVALGIVDVVERAEPARARLHLAAGKGELALATERGLAFLPWSPLGGIGNADGAADVSPVVAAAERARRLAAAGGARVAARAGPTVIPIPGSSRPETIADSARAVELELSGDELRAISAAVGA